MSKYEPLKAFLSERTEPIVRLRFSDVEAILGFALPQSALRYDEWWANNIDGHSHAHAWMDAGWRTEEVDRTSKTIAFQRLHQATSRQLARSDLFGRMKGSVVVRPGVDLTEPTGEVWNAERGILHD